MKIQNPDCVVLFSGGLDSCCALGDAIHDGYKKILCYTIDYGQVAFEKERTRGQQYIDELLKNYPDVVVDVLVVKVDIFQKGFEYLNLPMPLLLSNVEQTTNNNVPQRNFIFVSMALGFAELCNVERVYVGFGYSNDPTDVSTTPWDCVYDFVDFLNQFRSWKTNVKKLPHVTETQYNHVEPTIYSPMYRKRKSEYIEECIRRGYPVDLSWSCYAGGEKHCGECSSCKQRFATGVKE